MQPSSSDPRLAAAFAEEWIDAWNERDLDRILDHYDDDVVFRSPFATHVGDRSGTVSGKAALRDYFTLALARVPDQTFELERVLVGVGSVAVCYRGVRGVPAVEVMRLCGARARDVSCHYPEPTGNAGGRGRG